MTLALVCAAICGYLFGSCPNGYLIARTRGVDIRKHGSGNIGATNVLRVLGKKWGYLVFALDCIKGLVAVRVAFALAAYLHIPPAQQDIVGVVGALTCILGHSFPIWLRFRGGKGVATSAGALLGLMPVAVLSVFIVWLVLYKLTRYVSVASIGAAIALPIFVYLYLRLGWVTGASLLLFSILIAGVVIWRHRSNIKRLMQGTEQRFERK